jgi:4-amino-4-deoxy-L-arabinose transferase-like glycosyltransferase
LAGSDVIAAFLRGDFRATYWHFYPGVTMSWLDALGMVGQYWLQWLAGANLPSFTQYIYGDMLSLVVANRLPYAVLTAAAIPAIYLLARQLLPEAVALLGAFFLAFDPFFLAHSRVAHGDAPVAVFMSLSALTFFVYVRRINQQRLTPARRTLSTNSAPMAVFVSSIRQPASFYLLASAILGGLAALTKAPGQFMAIFVIGMSALVAGLEIWRASRARLRGAGSPAVPVSAKRSSDISLFWFSRVMVWGLVSLAVFVLVWPAMWVDPLGTIQKMWLETFTKVDEGHLVYFMGQPTLDPGPWFYPYVIPFRLTPVTLLGALLSVVWLVPPFNRRMQTQNSAYQSMLWFWLFTVSLLWFGILSPKKQDRYLLPLFPWLNLLAAAGWVGLMALARSYLKGYRALTRLPLRLAVYFLLLLLHFVPVVTFYPYYLSYFNPLLGGPGRAAQTTLMGWGEGMEQAAAYLNTKPNATRLYVASTPSQTLLPYFVGTGENFYTNDIAFRADYVVIYLSQRQRLAPSPEIVRYFQAQSPEKVITIQNVTYAQIYPGPKLILTDIPPEATPLNIGLDKLIRLAGYNIENQKLTLYWHALAPLTTNYTVSIRARAAAGRLLAQHDSWPVNRLLPTSQWRQGDYVRDTYDLDIAPADRAQLHAFEVVVYQAETGQTLGPTITLPVDAQP